MNRLLALVLTLLITTPAFAQGVCPRCGKVHANAAPKFTPLRSVAGSAGQRIAQARANYMARHDYRNHPPSSAGNFASVGTFEGVGWTSNPNAPQHSISTCVAGYPKFSRMAKGTHAGGPGKVLVGDAVARGPRGAYRVRIWR